MAEKSEFSLVCSFVSKFPQNFLVFVQICQNSQYPEVLPLKEQSHIYN